MIRALACSCARVIRQASAVQPNVRQFRLLKTSTNSLLASAKVRILKQPVRLTPTKAPLTLTPKAVSRIKELLSERPNVVGLRVSVRQRGCSGLTYTLDYVEESKAVNQKPSEQVTNESTVEQTPMLEKDIGRTQKQKHDVEVVQDGVRIFIDRRAQLTLLGTEMDFAETKLGAEFIFSNPNIKSTCGCGESFMLS